MRKTTLALVFVVTCTVALLAQTEFLQQFFVGPNANNCKVLAGSGTPEGAVTADVCTVFFRTNGASGSVIYQKASGSGNTGWEPVGGAPLSVYGAGTWSINIRKTADESVTSSTALQSDDHLNVPIGASERLLIEWNLVISASTAGDFKYALNVPAAATGVQGAFGLQAGATTTTDTINTAMTTTLTDAGAISLGGAGANLVGVRIRALVVNSTTAGTVTLRWAQNTSDGTATTIKANSSARAFDIDGQNVSTSTAANRPAAAQAGRLHLPSDAYQISRDTGSAWENWGPAFAFTTPSDTGFAWVNQGTATLVTTKDALTVTTPADNGGNNARMRVKTAPATPWTVTAFFQSNALNKGNHFYGLVWRQSSDGKFVECGTQGQTDASPKIGVHKFTNPTTFSASYVFFQMEYYHWLRITDDGANRTCSFSADGQNWIQLHTIGRTDFITADQVGFTSAGENIATPNQQVITALLSWKES